MFCMKTKKIFSFLLALQVLVSNSYAVDISFLREFASGICSSHLTPIFSSSEFKPLLYTVPAIVTWGMMKLKNSFEIKKLRMSYVKTINALEDQKNTLCQKLETQTKRHVLGNMLHQAQENQLLQQNEFLKQLLLQITKWQPEEHTKKYESKIYASTSTFRSAVLPTHPSIATSSSSDNNYPQQQAVVCEVNVIRRAPRLGLNCLNK